MDLLITHNGQNGLQVLTMQVLNLKTSKIKFLVEKLSLVLINM